MSLSNIMSYPDSGQAVFVPFVSISRFSELSGMPFNVVRGWADKGYLPTKKIGRHRTIDLVALAKAHQVEPQR